MEIDVLNRLRFLVKVGSSMQDVTSYICYMAWKTNFSPNVQHIGWLSGDVILIRKHLIGTNNCLSLGQNNTMKNPNVKPTKTHLSMAPGMNVIHVRLFF